MTNDITVTGDRAAEIFRALNGIDELLRALPSRPEDAAVIYAIMSNLTVIRMKLSGMPRVHSN